MMKSQILAYARSLGFDGVGVTTADSATTHEAFVEAWVDDGRAGEMTWMEREPARRARPGDHLTGAKSVIALAMNYFPGDQSRRAPSEGKISRYAWGRDYHNLIRKRLDALVRYINSLDPAAECRTFVDTGPLLERAMAQRAGLGFVGKNAMLITRGLGSWVFLASVVTTIALESDAPDLRSCGSCRLCIDACPTNAITEPYNIDARLCISYLTIEQPTTVAEPLRDRMDGWLYGCDVCQDVCPHNTRIPLTRELGFAQAEPTVGLRELLGLRSAEVFDQLFPGSPMRRAEWRGMVRNACLAAAHLERQDLIPQLAAVAQLEDPMLREHAVWALACLSSEGSATSRAPARTADSATRSA